MLFGRCFGKRAGPFPLAPGTGPKIFAQGVGKVSRHALGIQQGRQLGPDRFTKVSISSRCSGATTAFGFESLGRICR